MMMGLLRLCLGKGFVVLFLLLMAPLVRAAEASPERGEAVGNQDGSVANVVPAIVADATSITTNNDPSTGNVPSVDGNALETAMQGQVTSVSQLSDVRPTDWAFQSLQSLVERYGCIVGYPDKTYRGNRALSRYEFAAGLNACLDRINELIAAGTADLVKKEDLLALQKLQEEFAAELATLRGRVDALEVRTATLEKQQFSTTTKLIGQALFAVVGAFGDKKANSNTDIDDQIAFTDRVRLIFDSSFSGKDQLIVRFQAGNTKDYFDVTGTRMARLAFQDALQTNQVRINQLEYRFPLGDRGRAYIEAYGFLDLFVPTLHPLDGDYDTVLTGFGLRSPIYFPGGVAGAGFNYNITDAINIGGGYLAGNPNANNPAPKGGLFNGPYGALAQLTFRPTRQAAIALTYLNAYDDGNINSPPGGFFASQNATQPFGSNASLTNAFGVEAEYYFSPQFALSGWYYLAKAKGKGGITDGDDATVQAWAVALAFPDLGKKGNLGGIIVGMPSKTTDNDVSSREDRDTSIQIEAFYRYALNDFIDITPGIVVITNPDHNRNNDTTYLGVLRTVFKF